MILWSTLTILKNGWYWTSKKPLDYSFCKLGNIFVCMSVSVCMQIQKKSIINITQNYSYSNYLPNNCRNCRTRQTQCSVESRWTTNHPRTCPKSYGRILCTTSPPDIWWFARDKCLRKYLHTFTDACINLGKYKIFLYIFLWNWNFFKIILFIHFLNHGFG